MTLGLGPAVNGEVFGGGDGLEVFGVRTLQAAGKGKSDLTGEERIFSVGLLTAAPSRVAIDVDIGRPQSEAVIDNMVPLALGLVVLGSRFRGDRVGNPIDQPGVPGGRKPDGLRKDRGVAGPGDAVQAFIPPVVFGDVKPGNGRGFILHLRNLLVQSHAVDQVVHALRHGKIGVEI